MLSMQSGTRAEDDDEIPGEASAKKPPPSTTSKAAAIAIAGLLGLLMALINPCQAITSALSFPIFGRVFASLARVDSSRSRAIKRSFDVLLNSSEGMTLGAAEIDAAI